GIAGEDAVDEDRSAASQEKETWASGGLARARDEEGSAAAAGEEVTDTVSRRVAWVRGAAMQMMMCTPTFGHYLTLGQLSSFLDVPVADLKAVLLAPRMDAAVHDMFLKVFGIHKDTHGTDRGTSACWH
ncbi:unnamed protein product, partial [Pylaiella littoralis]